MASMRDAMRRLQVIYDACAPEAIEASTAEKNLDEFTRLKKRIHNAVKDIRVALKEREELLQRSGTTTETAEASYRARTMIRNLKEDTQRLDEIVTKEEKKKGKRKVEEDELVRRREIVQLCFQHIEECENLEKRRFNEKAGVDRLELLRGSVTSSGGPRRPYGITSDGDGVETNADRAALFEGAANARARKKADEDGGADPFLNSNLPDIDVDEDFEKLNERNKMIDQDLEDIEHGVKKLKELAQDMNQELDKQNEALKDLEKGVDQALDEVDNVNIKLKRALDHMMKGDRFMVNCILLCIILALVAFIASIFA
ncbi:hypothetical protein HK102_003042 [Quaeritorhiza haematococci]|nr:hypothetical protein HK102_003042 [Quaeritorhiza haematococci]